MTTINIIINDVDEGENCCRKPFRPAEVASGVWLLFTVVVQMADVTFSTTKANSNPQAESNQSWTTAVVQ
ncbi:hypothetical protein T4B_1011 [Trichinella pseudospiralis]|uniref:Uncharacterized protein n=1 Tax=Trichinella pseudospiralis TaxID=6337 RepID=A0A0V1EUD7_TRIPS|nr:hypothetical protein T4A_8887 [Trichinella pseudospiralis]KRZ26734.1 hypothetical protein T4B_1011 [Trichinella pseudospiralis]KRZ44792.1 hypothetical protein T4C_13663 [Trichinella pseudospiralis]